MTQSPILTTPTLFVKADGRALPEGAEGSIASATVRQQLGLPAQCEIRFEEPTRDLWSGQFVHPGSTLEVGVGPNNEPLFIGDVTCVEHELTLDGRRIIFWRAYDVLHRLRKRQRTGVHTNVTVQDLARRLAGDAGLSMGQVPSPGPVWKSLMHDGRDDLSLLRDVAFRCGLYPQCKGQALELLDYSGVGSVSLGVDKNLLSLRYEANTEHAVEQVQVYGWSPRSADMPKPVSRSTNVGRRIEREPSRKDAGGDKSRAVVNADVEGLAHAERLASALLDHGRAQTATIEGRAIGQVDLRPGVKVNVDGFAPHIDGDHVLTRVLHSIDPTIGYVVDISSRPVDPPSLPRTLTSAEGEVTAVDDPKVLGRVKVRLPSFGAIETEWLRVLTPGGGIDKGFITTPTVGDHVLVLMVSGDPAQAVVLGGLFPDKGTPDKGGVSGGKVSRFGLFTASGHRIVCDDEKGRLLISDAAGSEIELSSSEVKLSAKKNLTLEAPGRNITIRGKRIDFKQG